MIGKKFGRLIVLKQSNRKDNHYHIYWVCKCTCGKTKTINGSALREGTIKSCGCFHSEVARKIQKKYLQKHGKSGTSIYIRYKQIQVRCNKKTDHNYKNYGGRGIKLLWKTFEEFYKDMGPSYKSELTIDRIDNNGHYCKENCRWTTKREQALNRRTAHMLTYRGKTQNMKTWAREIGIENRTLWYRIKSGWSVELALETPVRKTVFY